MVKGKKSPEQSKEKRPIKRTLHYYWWAVKKHPIFTLVALASTPIIVGIRSVIIPLIIANIIGVVATNPSSEQIWQQLVPLAALAMGLRILASSILNEIRTYCHWKMEIYAMYDLANLAFDAVSTQSMQFHTDRFSGSLVSQTNKFVYAFERFFDSIVWSIMPMLVIIIASLAVLYVQAPLFAAILTSLIILYAIIAYIWFKKMAPFNEAHAEAENKQTGQLADSITNIGSVKSYAREAHEHRRFSNYARHTARTYVDLLHANIKRNMLFDFIYVGITGLILIFLLGGQHWFNLDFAVLYLMITYATTISDQLWSMNYIFKDMNKVFGDAKEMTEILDTEDTVVDAPDAKKLKVAHGDVKFTTITFQHQDAKQPIFQNFNLDIKPGERVGLVGISGSGKTTLTKLLLRFADVSAGKITIDGQNIKNVTQTSLRENIAYVPQETALFHRSIAENIAYARPDASQKEIEHAARLANAHEFIKDLPDGYNTLVGERGIKLSGGQRQRVAIARAILKDAPILVLDEATSALDSESEALIQDALVKLMKGRTSIVVAHRLSTIADMDRIVVLQNGKIAEQGSHAELVQKNGAYSKLWNRQSGAFLDEGK